MISLNTYQCNVLLYSIIGEDVTSSDNKINQGSNLVYLNQFTDILLKDNAIIMLSLKKLFVNCSILCSKERKKLLTYVLMMIG